MDMIVQRRVSSGILNFHRFYIQVLDSMEIHSIRKRGGDLIPVISQFS